MLNKLSSFLLFAGSIALVLFFLSVVVKAPDFNVLLIGGLVFFSGLFLYWLSPRKERKESSRFRLFRKGNDKNKGKK